MANHSQLLIAKNQKEISILPPMANRHGLIAGATGTGKTISLKVMAEAFSSIGVPVFLCDIKGDLASLAMAGEASPNLAERLKMLDINNLDFQRFPVRFWDVFGVLGHPVRTTISEMGPLLLSRLLDLNETQTGVMNIVFKIADDQGLLLIDLKDLRAMLKYAGDNAKEYTVDYGSVSKQSIGAIQRGLLRLEEQGGDKFFGEPALEISDFIKTDPEGSGIINILAAEKLFHSPALYAAFLMWMLAELFEKLPEIGDREKPEMVFFFDEAHLLFKDMPKALLEKIEQVVRLIRSKGVGIYFITQNPIDIPDSILGQLGNRIQHALRAYTPREQKAVKSAAETFRTNPNVNVEEVITELKVGEALISFLQEDGSPQPVERAWILPPASRFGTIPDEYRQELISNSPFFYKYREMFDRDSAYEVLQRRVEQSEADAERQKQLADEQRAREREEAARQKAAKTAATRKQPDTMTDKIIKSAVSSFSSQMGRSIARGILGSILKK